jgi:hypothetical protein
MARSSRDPLEELLRTENERVTNDVLQDPTQIPRDRIDGLARLAQLVEIRRRLEPSPASSVWNDWAPPIVLLATLFVATLLLFTPVGETEIELDVRVSEVGLRPGSDTVLLEGAVLQRLGVAGAQEASVRKTADWAGLDLVAAHAGTISLEIAPAGTAAASVTLGSIRTGPGTQVWIQGSVNPRQVRLVINSDQDVEVQASLLGPLQLAGYGVAPQTVDFKLPRPVLFRSERSTMTLDLMASEDESIRFAPTLLVEGLAFYRVTHADDRARRVSSLKSGFLYLTALNGTEERLREGQELRLDQVRGEIRTIQLGPGSLGLRFHGDVGGMETGSYEDPRNLMPGWLEWLRARHGASLLWGTALYIFGLVTAALRWFGRTHAAL